MKYVAGNITVDLPDEWEDASIYSYMTKDEALSLRVAHHTLAESATATSLLEDHKQRLGSLGSAKELERVQQSVRGVAVEWVALDIRRDGSAEPSTEGRSAARLLAANPGAGRGVVVTLLGPAGREEELSRVWKRILDGLDFTPGR